MGDTEHNSNEERCENTIKLYSSKYVSVSCVRTNFAGRLRILASSWATANNKKLDDVGGPPEEGEAAADGEAGEELAVESKKLDNKGMEQEKEAKAKSTSLSAMKVPA